MLHFFISFDVSCSFIVVLVVVVNSVTKLPIWFGLVWFASYAKKKAYARKHKLTNNRNPNRKNISRNVIYGRIAFELFCECDWMGEGNI